MTEPERIIGFAALIIDKSEDALVPLILNLAHQLEQFNLLSDMDRRRVDKWVSETLVAMEVAA